MAHRRFFGLVQAAAGTVDVFFGIVGAPVTFRGTALAIAPGVAYAAVGGLAFMDGVALLKTGFGGPSSGTTVGDLGQHIGGDNGQFVGDVAN